MARVALFPLCAAACAAGCCGGAVCSCPARLASRPRLDVVQYCAWVACVHAALDGCGDLQRHPALRPFWDLVAVDPPPAPAPPYMEEGANVTGIAFCTEHLPCQPSGWVQLDVYSQCSGKLAGCGPMCTLSARGSRMRIDVYPQCSGKLSCGRSAATRCSDACVAQQAACAESAGCVPYRTR
eukprot:gene26392-56932_t